MLELRRMVPLFVLALALPATAVIQALLSTYIRRHELIEELSDVQLPSDLEDDPWTAGHSTNPGDGHAGKRPGGTSDEEAVA